METRLDLYTHEIISYVQKEGYNEEFLEVLIAKLWNAAVEQGRREERDAEKSRGSTQAS